jgi:hypothetical protein
MQRSELGKIRITQLAEPATTPILNRNKTNISDINNGLLVIGRLFFVQLNGTSEYMKTPTYYSNATQLTVSA